MKKAGFTFIELICALLIFGILCAMAFPSYQTFICKTRRTEGQAALIKLAIQMENNFAKNHTYENIANNAQDVRDISSLHNAQSRWYQVHITEQTKKSFTLKAIPAGAQANDIQCQTLTLNSVNIKGIEPGPAGAPSGKPDDCW